MLTLQDEFAKVSSGKGGIMANEKKLLDALWASSGLIDINNQPSVSDFRQIYDGQDSGPTGKKYSRRSLKVSCLKA
jgi:hypothetical protein